MESVSTRQFDLISIFFFLGTFRSCYFQLALADTTNARERVAVVCNRRHANAIRRPRRMAENIVLARASSIDRATHRIVRPIHSTFAKNNVPT